MAPALQGLFDVAAAKSGTVLCPACWCGVKTAGPDGIRGSGPYLLCGLELASDSPFWWAVIFGANLGGNITPIGSASTLVAVTIIHKNKLPMSFAAFVKVAIPFAALQLAMAAAYVLIVLG